MQLTVERLESRLLLAASAELKGSTLVVTSDTDGDDIDLNGTGAGTLEVVINGGAAAPFTGVKNIKLISGPGGAEFELVDVDIAGSLSLNAQGPAAFSLETSDIGKNVKVNSRGEALAVSVDGGEVDGNFSCTAAGVAAMTFSSDTDELTIGRSVKLVTHGDATAIAVVASNSHALTIGRNFSVTTDDTTGLSLEGNTASECEVGGNVSVKFRGGNATAVEIEGVHVGHNFSLRTDDGEDTLTLEGGAFDTQIDGSLKVSLGDGDDSLSVEDTHIGRNASLDGGDDEDTAEEATDGTFDVNGKLDVDDFELGDLA